ncbi:MAG: hypothetical protein HY613_07160 [Candidatus Rokubacteria bacterium]|nr:hypothetical protein [Candidatus Rokubacteria bacterium]
MQPRKAQQSKAMINFDDRLDLLSTDDLRRVVRFIEDRFVNSVTPLSVRLQMEMPGTLRADRTLRAAQDAVKRVLGAVDEARNILQAALRSEAQTSIAPPCKASPSLATQCEAQHSEEIVLDTEAEHG